MTKDFGSGKKVREDVILMEQRICLSFMMPKSSTFIKTFHRIYRHHNNFSYFILSHVLAFMEHEEKCLQLHLTETKLRKRFRIILKGFYLLFFQAMDLEIPVLARDIPGNCAIIKHEDTGLLFTTPKVTIFLFCQVLICYFVSAAIGTYFNIMER